MPPLNCNEFEWQALVLVTLQGIEWEWHKSLPVNLRNYQFSQKCEIYTEIQWMFGIQAILDTMNQLSCHIIKYSDLWQQELPENHSQSSLKPQEIPGHTR